MLYLLWQGEEKSIYNFALLCIHGESNKAHRLTANSNHMSLSQTLVERQTFWIDNIFASHQKIMTKIFIATVSIRPFCRFDRVANIVSFTKINISWSEIQWLGLIPGFLGFWNSVNKSWIWESDIVELQFPRNIENPFFNFCVGAWVGEHPRENLSHRSKDALENSTSCDTSFMTVGETCEWKTVQKLKITGVEIVWVKTKSNKCN